MLVDSPYFPDELDVLPQVLGQAGFEPVGLLATHADYDHVLGRLAFPKLPIGVAESSMLRIREEPGAVQRELRDEDARNYVARPAPLGLGEVQSLPVPGKLEIGGEEMELHPGDGHSQDGMALFAPWCGVLCAGDYLSDVEIPWISSAGSLRDYRSTLARLGTLVERAESVVPGHGTPHSREDALRILDEDVDYLDALEAGRRELPKGRDTVRQREIHAENLAKHVHDPA
ncbi:MAG: MBL fold metallo-hydrolase [Thermoleophilaceae bacterium]|nr:MBL fold metallo-hydrolase [Thermoleophilaceae bacterium]